MFDKYNLKNNSLAPRATLQPKMNKFEWGSTRRRPRPLTLP